MISACRLFGYGSVLTFTLSLIFAFTLLLLGNPNAGFITIAGGIFGLIQGIIWGLNQ